MKNSSLNQPLPRMWKTAATFSNSFPNRLCTESVLCQLHIIHETKPWMTKATTDKTASILRSRSKKRKAASTRRAKLWTETWYNIVQLQRKNLRTWVGSSKFRAGECTSGWSHWTTSDKDLSKPIDPDWWTQPGSTRIHRVYSLLGILMFGYIMLHLLFV